jgi:hypothetical protein
MSCKYEKIKSVVFCGKITFLFNYCSSIGVMCRLSTMAGSFLRLYLVVILYQQQSLPLDFSKASLPSDIEKYIKPAAPIESTYAKPVNS